MKTYTAKLVIDLRRGNIVATANNREADDTITDREVFSVIDLVDRGFLVLFADDTKRYYSANDVVPVLKEEI